MKGLIIKDLRLLLQQKKSVLVILLCGVVMAMSTSGEFIAGWIMMIGALFGLGTMAYDENENCYQFLMTAPVSRKDYVFAKYLFCFLCILVFWILAAIFLAVSHSIKKAPVLGNGDVAVLLGALLVSVLIVALCLPARLKYGTERSRIVLLVIFGVFTVAAGLGSRLTTGKINAEKLSEAVQELPVSGASAVAAGIAVSLALTALSVFLSVRIMEKKEF